jgi:hypothetical protein
MEALLFRYLAARWKHPGSPYIRAGLALERRASALSAYWTDHQSRTRAAQARWAQTSGGAVLTVLGAGPLLDLNTAALSKHFASFRLVDANPLAAESWTSVNKPVEPVITDITNCLGLWRPTVKQFRGAWPETLKVIREVAAAPAYSAPTDALLSLNILSQLEIGWQEAVEPILRKRFGERFVVEHEQEWLDAIRPGSQMLIEQHLAALQASGARQVLLICDIEYVEYTGRLYQRHQWAEPPLRWTESGWRADEGITYEAVPALEGVVLNRESFARWMPSYELDWHESWLWHIAPNGTETAKYGRLHRVGAFALRVKAQP